MPARSAHAACTKGGASAVRVCHRVERRGSPTTPRVYRYFVLVRSSMVASLQQSCQHDMVGHRCDASSAGALATRRINCSHRDVTWLPEPADSGWRQSATRGSQEARRLSSEASSEAKPDPDIGHLTELQKDERGQGEGGQSVVGREGANLESWLCNALQYCSHSCALLCAAVVLPKGPKMKHPGSFAHERSKQEHDTARNCSVSQAAELMSLAEFHKSCKATVLRPKMLVLVWRHMASLQDDMKMLQAGR